MKVESTTAAETYGWLGDLPGLREWLGDRVINSLSGRGYTIVNREFEETLGVRRTNIEDDQYGIYAPLFEKMGHDARCLPDLLLFGLLAVAHTIQHYDGQYFFDIDHPVGVGAGVRSVSNYAPGAAPAWFLIDGRHPIKPLIYQERRPFKMISIDDPEDPHVFMKNEFIFATDGRCNVGLGLWQMAYRSQEPLNEVSFSKARTTMQRYTNDAGAPLGVRPTHMIVPPELELTARQLILAETINGGDTNPWSKAVEVIVCPYLPA